MSQSRTFEIYLQGIREGQELKPELLDVNEMIEIMENGRDLLNPDGRRTTKISVDFQGGSVRVLFLAAASEVIQLQALIEEVQKTHDLSLLASKQRQSVLNLQKMAIEQDFQIDLSEKDAPRENRLHITRNTEKIWKQTLPVWVNAELYLKGKITDMGGKTKPNIHLDTDDYDLRSVTIAATEEQLASDQKNRLYKEQKVRVIIKQDFETGEYDPKSASLIEFVDPLDTNESDDEYINRLIKQASPAWSDVEDSEAWLREIRGYEGD